MKVASPEHCQELYKLSGWGATIYPSQAIEGEIFPESIDVDELPAWQDGVLTGDEFFISSKVSNTIPAYTLGYLLRKLPPYLGTQDDDWLLRLMPSYLGESWSIGYAGLKDNRFLHAQQADNPENAAALLAIELHRQGILPGEVQSPAQASKERP